MTTNKRRNFNLRLQPYDGSLLAEVVDYLNSLERDELNKVISDLLISAFLPLARHNAGNYLPEQLRITCINSCDSLLRHSEYIRQVLQVNHPRTIQVLLSNIIQTDDLIHTSSSVHSSPKSSAPSSDSVPSHSNPADDMDKLFGFDDD